jgi:acyl-CoA thioester hydrolase
MEPRAPLSLHHDTVRSEWIDFNGHMNVAYYVLAFDRATDRLLEYLGLGEEYVRLENGSVFVVDMNVSYRRELREGEPFNVTTQLLGFDEKRVHLFHHMFRDDGDLAATNKILALHVDMRIRRAAAFPLSAASMLADLGSVHRNLSQPDGAGRVIGLAGDFYKNGDSDA